MLRQASTAEGEVDIVQQALELQGAEEQVAKSSWSADKLA